MPEEKPKYFCDDACFWKDEIEEGIE